jgi:plastocyanin
MVAACGGDTPSEPETYPSTLVVSTPTEPPPRFIPATAHLAAGGSVTFRNGAPVEGSVHEVESRTNAWPKRTIMTGESFSVTLTEPGTYLYDCPIHPGMSGAITVH